MRIWSQISMILMCASFVQAEDLKFVGRIFNPRSATFVNQNCSRNDTCNLLKVDYLAEDYEEEPGLFGTRLHARYETRSVSDLEDYVFVQILRGCAYTSEGSSAPMRFMPLQIFGKQDPMDFPDWVIDSTDTDPAYLSKDGLRHVRYEWNRVSGSFNQATEEHYSEKHPAVPVIYAKDFPQTAFYSAGSNRAINVSLKFRTCLYKAIDVPKSADLHNTNFAEPISCFDWASSFIYDYTANRFSQPQEIAQACFAGTPDVSE